MDKDLKNLTPERLQRLVEMFGQKAFQAGYLFTFIHQKGAADLDQITPLPKDFRQALRSRGYVISTLTLRQQYADPDGTRKFVFDLPGGSRIETVCLRDGDRNTVCLSTQAGCRMGCVFCATGQLPFDRNLTAAEIVDQVYQVRSHCGAVHNVVYMGMGEPLDNLDAVMRSAALLNDENGANIGIRHITLSTCGLPAAIGTLAACDLRPRLAVSLHAPDDATRRKLMPVARKYPIDSIIAALRDYQRQTARRITVEYCLARAINDSDTHARLLVARLKGLKVNVNLIELNPFTGCPFEASPPKRIKAFAEVLKNAGLETAIRYRRGRRIQAACGQLGATQIKHP